MFHIYSALKSINGFQSEYRWLSNFWPCYLVYEGDLYPTAEHAYQSAKVDDPTLKKKILACSTPAEAKDFVDALNIAPLNWTTPKKLLVMETILKLKFGGQHPFLTRALLETGTAELVEANTWNDTFWGVCNGTGENHLGKLLMKIRANLVEEKEQIIRLLSEQYSLDDIVHSLSITRRELYEKMMAFRIAHAEFWIS